MRSAYSCIVRSDEKCAMPVCEREREEREERERESVLLLCVVFFLKVLVGAR